MIGAGRVRFGCTKKSEPHEIPQQYDIYRCSETKGGASVVMIQQYYTVYTADKFQPRFTPTPHHHKELQQY